MKHGKVLGLILGICLFFLLNNLDQRYFNQREYRPSFDFPKLAFGIDSQKAQDELTVKMISVNNDGDIKSFMTKANTPIDALVENGYSVSNMNKVITTAPLTRLTNHAYIILQTYRTTIEQITISIPYEKLAEGETLCQNLSKEVVEQAGVLGIETQTIKKTYEGKDLVATEITDQEVLRAPINEIIILQGPDDSPNQVPQIGYNCSYWDNVIDNEISATVGEKSWLEFAMMKESGCNAESNSGYYKGLLQWDPCIWYEQFPNDNIFDGRAQINHSLAKLRAGADPSKMWPAVYKLYIAQYGSLDLGY